MLAIVMSGAANYGAMQAGALESILNVGYRPQMVVGTSAGALNAIYIASDPTPEGARRLGEVWGMVSPNEVGKGGMFTGIRRLLARKDSLFPNPPLVRYLEEYFPKGVTTFGELYQMRKVLAYTVAVCMETRRTVVFGDCKQDRILDGAMASIALPPYFPPWQVNGYRYIDGGVTSKLPLLAAIERGATQIVAIEVENPLIGAENARDIFSIGYFAVSMMSDHQAKMEISIAKAMGVPLRIFYLLTPPEVGFWDFTQAEYLYQIGKRVVEGELKRHPLRISPAWQSPLWRTRVRFVRKLLGIHKNEGVK